VRPDLNWDKPGALAKGDIDPGAFRLLPLHAGERRYADPSWAFLPERHAGGRLMGWPRLSVGAGAILNSVIKRTIHPVTVWLVD
jgi:hypothetical protein